MAASSFIRKAAAEFAGTFLIVFLGCGSIVIDQQYGGCVTHAGISITFGLAVTISIILFAKFSGAHFNPAVSIAFAAARKLSASELLPYLLAQLAGGFAGSLLLFLLFPANEKLGASLPSGTELQSFVLELLLTFLLMFVILRASAGNKLRLVLIAGVIGLVVGLEAFFAGPYCGASMNPARSLAPAIVSGHTESLWLYILAPVSGAVLAVFADRLLFREKQAVNN